MVAETGLVTGSEIKKNRDGGKPVRLLQVVISDPDDVQTVEWIGKPGEDNGLQPGDTVAIITIGSTKFAIAADDGITPDAADGEKKLYSRSGDAKAAEVIFRVNGDIELNGNADFLISFNQLKQIIDAFATDLNAEFTAVATAINGIAPESYTPTVIEFDITAAKVEDLKIGN